MSYPGKIRAGAGGVAACAALLWGCAQFDSQGSALGVLLLGGGSGGGAASSSIPANWTATAYDCRQQVTITASSAIAVSSLVTFSFDHASLVSAGKSLASGDDVRVFYEDGSGTELDRALVSGSSWNSSSTKLAIKAQVAISAGGSDGNYYLYYCDPTASSPPTSVPAGNSTTTESTAAVPLVNDTNYNTVASSTITPTSTSEVRVWFATFGIKSDVAQTNNATNFTARVTVNGAADTEIEQQSNEGDHYKMMIVTGIVTGTTASQTIGVDIKSENTGTTTTIKNLRIVSFLMPTDADFHSAIDDTETSVTHNWTAVGPVLTFTPSSAGDYYIVAAGQFHENPSGSTAGMRLLSHDGSYWPQVGADSRYAANGRGSYDTFFVMRKETLTATAKTFQFEFQSSGSGGGASEYKGLRMYAFRADAFEAAESRQDLAASNTSSTTQVVKSTLATSTPAGARDHVIIQNQWVYDTNSGTTHQKLADATLDGVVLSDQDHVVNNSNYHFASGAVHSLNTASSVTLENRYWTNNVSIDTFSKESVIHVLRFKDGDSSLGTEETQ